MNKEQLELPLGPPTVLKLVIQLRAPYVDHDETLKYQLAGTFVESETEYVAESVFGITRVKKTDTNLIHELPEYFDIELLRPRMHLLIVN